MRRLGLKGPFPIKSCGHDIGQSDVVGGPDPGYVRMKQNDR